jgi:hypothetical protein
MRDYDANCSNDGAPGASRLEPVARFVPKRMLALSYAASPRTPA